MAATVCTGQRNTICVLAGAETICGVSPVPFSVPRAELPFEFVRPFCSSETSVTGAMKR